MPSDKLESWELLEKACVSVLTALGGLEAFRGHGHKVFGLLLPSHFGFNRPHRTERIAYRQACISRDWFGVMMGALTYMVMAWEVRCSGSSTEACLEAGMSNEWLSLFQTSDVYVRNIERVGCFMLLKDSTVPFPEMRLLRLCNIPMWYPWGEREEKILEKSPSGFWAAKPSHWISPTIVTNGVVTRSEPAPSFDPPPLPSDSDPAASNSTWGNPDSSSMWGNPDPSSTSTWGNPSESQDTSGWWHDSSSRTARAHGEPASRQRPGETWKQFFTRQNEENEKIKGRETPKDRQAREARERDRGLNKATFWEWVKDDDGKLKRTWVPRGEGQRLHDEGLSRYMRYDAFRREWDFCEEEGFSSFGTAHETMNDDDADDDDDDDDDGYFGTGVAAPNNHPLASPPRPPTPPPEDTLPPHPSVITTLDRRYGFAPDFQDTVDVTPCTDDMWAQTMTILGHFSARPEDPVANLVVWFVNDLIEMFRTAKEEKTKQESSSGSVMSIRGTERASSSRGHRRPAPAVRQPQELEFKFSALQHRICDVCPAHPRRLSTITVKLLTVKRIHVPSQRPGIDKEVQFILGSCSKWSLALLTPEDLMHACRLHQSNDVRETALQLVQLGVPFRTFAHLDSGWKPRTRIRTRGRAFVPLDMPIPFRSKDYIFTANDYAVYEDHRDGLLRQAHAHGTALRMGGIVWRLAQASIFDWEALIGPSDSSTVYGFGTIVEDGTTLLCEDLLSANELDLICGLHNVFTGMSIY